MSSSPLGQRPIYFNSEIYKQITFEDCKHDFLKGGGAVWFGPFLSGHIDCSYEDWRENLLEINAKNELFRAFERIKDPKVTNEILKNIPFQGKNLFYRNKEMKIEFFPFRPQNSDEEKLLKTFEQFKNFSEPAQIKLTQIVFLEALTCRLKEANSLNDLVKIKNDFQL